MGEEPQGRVLRLEEGFFVEWGGLGNAEEPEGAVELTMRIDPEFVGEFAAQAVERGTETSVSNVVGTQVFAPRMLPQAGSGSKDGSFPLVILALILSGAVILTIGTIATLARRARKEG